MRACPVCLIEFPEPTGAQRFKEYCSRNCKVKAKNRRNAIAADRHRAKVQCGTHSGYTMHRRRGEDACASCKDAASAYSLARARGRGIKPRPPIQGPIYPCLNCGNDASRSRFCSKKCRAEFVVPAIPCAECETPFIPTHRAQKYCSIPCRARHNNNIGRALGKSWIVNTYKDTPERRAIWERRQALIRGATAPGELVNRREVFDRDGWVCGLCDTSVDLSLKYPDPASVSLDHIVPVSLGGMHAMSNVQCSHLFCNLSKNNRVA